VGVDAVAVAVDGKWQWIQSVTVAEWLWVAVDTEWQWQSGWVAVAGFGLHRYFNHFRVSQSKIYTF
jgi:hypothetical protein